ncbi:hypothetical protein WKW47_01575 [Staphylococcus nepalensis]|nr:hypothetical protein [Staphylococcus nepalensis]
MDYAPFAMIPIISVIFGYIGFEIVTLKESDKEDSDNRNLV